MDNDAQMLQQLGTALTALQIKYRGSPVTERMQLKPQLESLLKKYGDYQLRLIAEGVITTDDDLQQMEAIKKAIDAAAEQQQLTAAIARTIAFVATKLA